MDGWLASYTEEIVLRILGFLKDRSWGSTVEAHGWIFSNLIRADQFRSWAAEMNLDVRQHKLHRVFGGCSGEYELAYAFKNGLSPSVS